MKDMSRECGIHYEEYWIATHINHTMPEEEFYKWYDEHCGKCEYMNETCMKDLVML